MRKVTRAKLLLVFAGVILAVSLFWLFPFLKKKQLPPLPSAKAEGAFLFIPIQVLGFSEDNIPCFNVNIESNKFIFKLDLGLNSAASISGEFLPKINEKAFVKTSMKAGFRGNFYEVNTYQIPKFTIGMLDFHPILLVEENKLLQAESQIGKQKKESLGPIAGKIGWKVFEKTGLFLDFRHSMIIVCDSAETLEKQGYSLGAFTKIPIIKEHDLIEFDVPASRGTLRCLLDTGCSHNFIHAGNGRNKSLERMITKKKRISSFMIGGEDFGPVIFSKLSIQCPFHIDAILGMEFMLNHVVFIDFVKSEVYFSKSSD